MAAVWGRSKRQDGFAACVLALINDASCLMRGGELDPYMDPAMSAGQSVHDKTAGKMDVLHIEQRRYDYNKVYARKQ